MSVHAFPMAACLLFPEQEGRRGLISWERAVADWDERPREEHEPVLHGFLPFALDHPDPAVRLQIELAVESTHNAKLRMCMLGAAIAGCLSISVGDRLGVQVQRTHRDLWRRGIPHIANPATMALSGKFAVVCSLLASTSLPPELSGADLYVKSSEFKHLTKLRGGSEAGIRRAAQQIVGEFVAQNPGDRMTNEEMRQQLRPHFPGASERALNRAIAVAKLSKWTESGRRRGRR